MAGGVTVGKVEGRARGWRGRRSSIHLTKGGNGGRTEAVGGAAMLAFTKMVFSLIPGVFAIIRVTGQEDAWIGTPTGDPGR